MTKNMKHKSKRACRKKAMGKMSNSKLPNYGLGGEVLKGISSSVPFLGSAMSIASTIMGGINEKKAQEQEAENTRLNAIRDERLGSYESSPNYQSVYARMGAAIPPKFPNDLAALQAARNRGVGSPIIYNPQQGVGTSLKPNDASKLTTGSDLTGYSGSMTAESFNQGNLMGRTGGMSKTDFNKQYKKYKSGKMSKANTPGFEYLMNQNPSWAPESFALGGMPMQPNAEVEGGEVVDTPTGQSFEVQGPSHEQGGVAMNLPGNSEVYTDSMFVPGTKKTFAEIKAASDKKVSKYEDIINDPNSTRTSIRTAERNKNNEEAKSKKLFALQQEMNGEAEKQRQQQAMQAQQGQMQPPNGMPGQVPQPQGVSGLNGPQMAPQGPSAQQGLPMGKYGMKLPKYGKGNVTEGDPTIPFAQLSNEAQALLQKMYNTQFDPSPASAAYLEDLVKQGGYENIDINSIRQGFDAAWKQDTEAIGQGYQLPEVNAIPQPSMNNLPGQGQEVLGIDSVIPSHDPYATPGNLGLEGGYSKPENLDAQQSLDGKNFNIQNLGLINPATQGIRGMYNGATYGSNNTIPTVTEQQLAGAGAGKSSTGTGTIPQGGVGNLESMQGLGPNSININADEAEQRYTENNLNNDDLNWALGQSDKYISEDQIGQGAGFDKLLEEANNYTLKPEDKGYKPKGGTDPTIGGMFGNIATITPMISNLVRGASKRQVLNPGDYQNKMGAAAASRIRSRTYNKTPEENALKSAYNISMRNSAAGTRGEALGSAGSNLAQYAIANSNLESKAQNFNNQNATEADRLLVGIGGQDASTALNVRNMNDQNFANSQNLIGAGLTGFSQFAQQRTQDNQQREMDKFKANILGTMFGGLDSTSYGSLLKDLQTRLNIPTEQG